MTTPSAHPAEPTETVSDEAVRPVVSLASKEPADWWKAAVVYQVYPRSFADSDGDGVGDLRGVINRLDHLVLLGVDVVWLSPFYASPQHDNGYDISDYQAIDPVFGTLADFDELVAEAHDRGLKIVLDIVVNHTSDEHAWFVESRQGRGSAKRDWYWWRPAREGHEPGTPGAEPSNWASTFLGPAWTYDDLSGEYFLHLYSEKMPDLNWENPEVRQAVCAMMRWWLDRGVDGFRLDVINQISKAVDDEGNLPDVPAGPGSPWGDASAYFANGPRIHEFLGELRREVFDGRNLLVVGETPGATVEDAKRYTDTEHGSVNMVFTFEHVDLDREPQGSKWDLVPLSLTDLKANLGRWQEGLAASGWNSLYWSNHDQPRIVSRWGDDGEHRVESAKSLGTVLHLLRGTPYVYQGEELGMTNAHFTTLSEYDDIESLNYAEEALRRGVDEARVMHALAVKSRDHARTPMQWDASPHAGFTAGTPWQAVNPNHVDINAEAAVADPDSVFHHYRKLIALRHALPVVVHGGTRMLLPEHEQVFAYVRELADQRLLVVANLSGAEVQLAGGDLTGDPAEDTTLLRGELLLTTHEPAVATDGGLALRAWESQVLLSRGGESHL